MKPTHKSGTGSRGLWTKVMRRNITMKMEGREWIKSQQLEAHMGHASVISESPPPRAY